MNKRVSSFLAPSDITAPIQRAAGAFSVLRGVGPHAAVRSFVRFQQLPEGVSIVCTASGLPFRARKASLPTLQLLLPNTCEIPLLEHHGYAWRATWIRKLCVAELLNKKVYLCDIIDTTASSSPTNAGGTLASGIIYHA